MKASCSVPNNKKVVNVLIPIESAIDKDELAAAIEKKWCDRRSQNWDYDIKYGGRGEICLKACTYEGLAEKVKLVALTEEVTS